MPESRFTNAALGAALTVGLVFVPLSPLLGGGAAGYFQGGSSRDGARMGAYAGLIALIPLAIFLAFFGAAIGLPLAGAARTAVRTGLLIAGAVVYVLGLSALGGVVGAYFTVDVPEP